MKVVHVTARYFPNVGGVETVVRELCEGLTRKGLETKVYCLDSTSTSAKTEVVNGVLVKRYRPIFGDPLFLPPISFLRDLRKESPSIIHVHNIQNFFPFFVSMLRKSNQKFVLQPHYHHYGQNPFRHLLLSLYRRIIPGTITNRANVIVANSKYEEMLLKKDFSSPRNIVTVKQGLSLRELSSIHWSPAETRRILYVGSFKKYKKVDVILKAFKILQNRTGNFHILVLIGNGPESRELRFLAQDLGISERVEWKSNVSRQQLLAEYAKTSVFVLLSRLESFSIAVNEALAIGVPTVVPKGEVFSELSANGLVESVSAEEPEDVADAILRAERKHIGKKDIHSRPEIYDVSEYTNKLATIYSYL